MAETVGEELSSCLPPHVRVDSEEDARGTSSVCVPLCGVGPAPWWKHDLLCPGREYRGNTSPKPGVG